MPSHIIQRQIIEVTTEHTVDGFAFKEQLAELCKRKLLPAIEQLFDSKAAGHKILRCGKLMIDAGELPFENWETLLVDRVLDELTKRISAAVPLAIESEVHTAEEEDIFQEISEDENTSRSILYFLEHGSLPWFSFIKSGEVLHNWMMKLIESSRFLDRLLKLVKTNPETIGRLTQQFDLQVSEKIIVKSGIDENFIQAIKDFWRPIFKSLNMVESSQSKIIYRILLGSLRDLKTSLTVDKALLILKRIIEEFSHDNRREILPMLRDKAFEFSSELIYINDELEQDDEKAKPINEKTRKLSISPDYWYVTNAGLTILHPFLSGLFYNVGYTEKDEWINDDARYRALALTQYLVTGKEECPEFNLMLNKIFTGYPLEESLPAQVTLSDFEKDEAVDLLKSVIHHWTALKNTSVDGLRSTFLSRDAKLSTNENGWLLQVGQKTVDILMNKLPWGILIIKTPWMDKKMHVEWT